MRNTLVSFAPALVDPFARAQRRLSRMHPRRDPEGHPNGGGGDPSPEGDPKPEPEGDPKPEPEPDKDPDKIDWKAMARKHEDEAKKNRAAASELEKIKESKRTAEEKAQKERDDAKAEAAEAKAEAARERAARKYGLTDDDLAFLEGVPADKFDERAKALSERLKTATPAGKGAAPIDGKGDKPKPKGLAGAIGAHYSK
ncbi:hypothetical protein CH267_02105 [Rhodococcus sp. 06-621-2]|nr:hypothetical protein [Rhodococcus sp. 06-621-2]OZC62352.1 hypothetical protein CH267_02105 [Rhodococcus sp. 06-621-2]